MNKYQTIAEPIQPEPPKISDKQFLHTTGAAVVVPLLIAVVTGFLVMVLSMVIMGKALMDILDILFWGFIVGVLTTLVVWVVLLLRWFKISDLEKITNTDINRDGHIGETRNIRVQIDRLNNNGHLEQSQMFDFSGIATEEQLVTFFDGVLNQHKTLAESNWKGKVFSKTQWPVFRAELLKRGLAAANNDKSSNMGFSLTELGERVGYQILASSDVETTSSPAPG